MWLSISSSNSATLIVFILLRLTNFIEGQGCSKDKSTLLNNRKMCNKELIYEESFDNFDKDQWRNDVQFSSSPDYEFVVYDDSINNTYIKNGVLHLRPTLLADAQGEDFLKMGTIKLDEYPSKCTSPVGSKLCSRRASNGFRILPPIVSSKVRSGNFKFRYGTVEVRAKMPLGDWIYSQIYLEPVDKRYGPDSSGKIIIATSRGNQELKNPSITDNRIDFGCKWLECGVLLNTYNPRESADMLAQLSTQGGWHKDFHNYKVSWTHEALKYYVDDKLIGEIKTPKDGFLPGARNKIAPFDENFQLSLGVAVGGIQHFPDDVTSGGKPKPWRNLSPKGMMNFWNEKALWYPSWHGDQSALQIDYVKVWAV